MRCQPFTDPNTLDSMIMERRSILKCSNGNMAKTAHSAVQTAPTQIYDYFNKRTRDDATPFGDMRISRTFALL